MQIQPGRLVTPEAVVLDVPHAGPGTRMAAKFIDILIQFAALLLINLVIAAGAGGNGGGVALVVIGLFADVLILFGYPAILESTWRGRTVGKAAFGMRVLTREGAPIRFRHALIRSLLFIVDGLLIGPTIGVLCLVLTKDTLRVGDLVAGTIVIRERTGAAPPVPVSFQAPYGYEDYVASLDVGGLNSGDYELVRGFLLRAGQLSPEVRYPLAIELANPIIAKLHITAPSMHPELFLQCLAAAMQRRFAGVQTWGYPPPGPQGWQAPTWGPPLEGTGTRADTPQPYHPDRGGFAPPM